MKADQTARKTRGMGLITVLLLLGIGILGLTYTNPEIKNLVYRETDGVEIKTQDGRIYRKKELAFNMRKSDLPGQTRFHIRHPGKITEISVNKSTAEIKTEDPRDDIEKGTEVDLKEALWVGGNEVVIKINETSATTRPVITPSMKDPLRLVFFMGLMAGILLGFGLLAKRTRLSALSVGLLTAGLVVLTVQLIRTGPENHTHDIQAHLDYIGAVKANFFKPVPAGDCFVCYHPSLYYRVAALWQKAVEPLLSEHLSLRLLSFLFYGGFLIFGLKIIEKVFRKSKTGIFWAGTFLCLFPVGLITGIRPGNDILLNLFAAGAVYFSLCYTEKRNRKDFFTALTLSVLAIMTKSNGMIPLAFLAVVLCKKGMLKKSRPEITGLIFAGLLLLASTYKGGVIANTDNMGNIGVETGLKTFTFSSIKPYLNYPFTNYGNDEEKSCFWTNFLKTSLFGEFKFSPYDSWARVLQRTFLGLWIGVPLIVLIRRKKTNVPFKKELGIYIGLSLAAIIAMTVKYPFISSRDFRYVYPMLVPMAAFFGMAVQSFSWKNPFYWITACAGLTILSGGLMVLIA